MSPNDFSDDQAAGGAHRREAGDGRDAAEGGRGGEGQVGARAKRHRQAEQTQVIYPAPRHFFKRHFTDGHFPDRHFSERYFSERTVVEKGAGYLRILCKLSVWLILAERTKVISQAPRHFLQQTFSRRSKQPTKW